jgi:DNA modification methylase
MLITSTPYPGQRGFNISSSGYLDWWHQRLGAWVPKLHTDGVVVQNVGPFSREGGFFNTGIFDIPRVAESLSLRTVDVYVWDKLNAPPSGNQRRTDRNEWELVYVFAKSANYVFNPSRQPYSTKTIGKARTGIRKPDVSGGMAGGHSRLSELGARMGNVIRLSSSGDQRRPRVKGGSYPRGLADRFIRQYSNAGDAVIDPFVGAGTSLVVASALGRRAVGVDTSAEACRISSEWSGFPSFNREDRKAS